MNIIIAIKPSGAEEFPGTNQVVHQTNQVVQATPKRPSENTDTEHAFEVRSWYTLLSCVFLVYVSIATVPGPTQLVAHLQFIEQIRS